MDNQNLNIFLKLLEKSGSDMNNINSFINNLQNNEMDKLKNIFIGKNLYCTFDDKNMFDRSGERNIFCIACNDREITKNNYDFIILKDNDCDKPFILIVEDKKIIDLLSFIEFDKHFIHFPNTLKFILSNNIYKLNISYTTRGRDLVRLKNFIVVDFNKIVINFLDLSNVCNKYIKL